MQAVLERRIQIETEHPRKNGHQVASSLGKSRVIPVVDLRLKFGMAEMVYSSRTCIIVTEVEGESGPMMIGAVVDGVSEVLNLVAADIEDTPDFGGEVSTTGLLGMAKVKGKVKILLDIDQVMTQQDLKELGKIFS